MRLTWKHAWCKGVFPSLSDFVRSAPFSKRSSEIDI